MATPPPERPAYENLPPGWDFPLALPVEGDPDPSEAIPMALPLPPPLPASVAAAQTEPELRIAVPAAFPCPACGTSSPSEQEYCYDCGYYFSESDRAARSSSTPPLAIAVLSAERLRERYELKVRISERAGVERFHALDHAAEPPAAVVMVRQPLPPALPSAEPIPAVESDGTEEILPSFDDPPPAVMAPTEAISGALVWPSIAWERRLLHSIANPALPAEMEHFSDETHEYLVLESPQGTLLWDAWDDTEAGAAVRFGYLAQIAEAMHRLHEGNAMLEGLRPDIVVVQDGRARITDISDLLPLPFPPGTPVRGRLYTAPELLAGHGQVDARADLYSFGAMLYALHVGSELNENRDFDGPGNPKPFIPRFCDIHPAFGRLMMKTFRKDVHSRFPTDEAKKTDATGFLDLIRTLQTLQRTFDDVRLEIASWTSTGIVRTGNEDAFCLLHAAESRQDDLGEAALVILCDGMGGYEAGEVAAALTIQHLRRTLTKEKPFSVAAGASPFPNEPLQEKADDAESVLDVAGVKHAIKQALRDANKAVFQASRAPGSKRRGMGCTAEVVYVDGRHVIVGHVGDSRTYHLHEGRLIQMTRDQTLVNRLVELGTLSPEEAETHPRRNELQQAIGGQPDVDPGLYHGRLSPGDWVVVCSDGLTNHVTPRDLQQMLQSEATSAEMAARRLVNLTLIEGATDNVTVVAIRAT